MTFRAVTQRDTGEQLVVSGLEPGEVRALKDWFCYTKPIGPSRRVVVLPAPGGRIGFCVLATGNEPGPSEEPSTVKLAPPP